MQGSRYDSVVEHRQCVVDGLEDNPSLKSFLAEAVEKAYPDARKIAIKEGKLAKFGVSIPPESEYPTMCPFTIEQILDENFYGAGTDQLREVEHGFLAKRTLNRLRTIMLRAVISPG